MGKEQNRKRKWGDEYRKRERLGGKLDLSIKIGIKPIHTAFRHLEKSSGKPGMSL